MAWLNEDIRNLLDEINKLFNAIENENTSFFEHHLFVDGIARKSYEIKQAQTKIKMAKDKIKKLEITQINYSHSIVQEYKLKLLRFEKTLERYDKQHFKENGWSLFNNDIKYREDDLENRLKNCQQQLDLMNDVNGTETKQDSTPYYFEIQSSQKSNNKISRKFAFKLYKKIGKSKHNSLLSKKFKWLNFVVMVISFILSLFIALCFSFQWFDVVDRGWYVIIITSINIIIRIIHAYMTFRYQTKTWNNALSMDHMESGDEIGDIAMINVYCLVSTISDCLFDFIQGYCLASNISYSSDVNLYIVIASAIGAVDEAVEVIEDGLYLAFANDIRDFICEKFGMKTFCSMLMMFTICEQSIGMYLAWIGLNQYLGLQIFVISMNICCQLAAIILIYILLFKSDIFKRFILKFVSNNIVIQNNADPLTIKLPKSFNNIVIKENATLKIHYDVTENKEDNHQSIQQNMPIISVNNLKLAKTSKIEFYGNNSSDFAFQYKNENFCALLHVKNDIIMGKNTVLVLEKRNSSQKNTNNNSDSQLHIKVLEYNTNFKFFHIQKRNSHSINLKFKEYYFNQSLMLTESRSISIENGIDGRLHIIVNGDLIMDKGSIISITNTYNSGIGGGFVLAARARERRRKNKASGKEIKIYGDEKLEQLPKGAGNVVLLLHIKGRFHMHKESKIELTGVNDESTNTIYERSGAAIKIICQEFEMEETSSIKAMTDNYWAGCNVGRIAIYAENLETKKGKITPQPYCKTLKNVE